MLKVLRHMRPKDWIQFGVSLVFIVAQVWLDLKLPDYMAAITQLVQTPGSSMAEIWRQGGFMLLCALGSIAAAVVVGFFAARIAASLAQELRSLLFEKVTAFSMEEMSQFSTASLITRSTNDVTQIQLLVAIGMQLVVKAPIMAVWAVTKIAGKGVEWSVATGTAVGVLIVAIAVVMAFVVPKFRRMQTLTDGLNRVTRENLTGLRVVRAYNAEAYQEDKFEAVNDDLTRTQLFTSRAMAALMPMMSAVVGGLSLAIYWIGAHLVQAAGALDRLVIFADMVVFSQYAMQVIMSFMMLAIMFVLLPRASVSARRINEVLATEPTITGGGEREGRSELAGHVEFRNVSFKYPDAADYVLRDINFSVKAGETVAFIGSTGSGKSTLIHLVPRFFDATEGEVLVNGVNVKDYDLEALYDKIGYVPQKAVLFKGTVKDNVAFGENGRPPAGLDEVQRAVAIAQGADFVEAMERGYEAAVAQGGSNLSGGQRQRLSIARAVCRQPEIYIFDDSFSALDYKTDRQLRTMLKRETAGVTTMIVAQRIGTIMDADQIIVLDEGRMVGNGTHRELLESCDVYREIALSQFGEGELAS